MADTPDHIDIDIADIEEALRKGLRAELDPQIAAALAAGEEALDDLIAYFPKMVDDLGSELIAMDILGGSMARNDPGKTIVLAVIAIRRLANQQQH